LPDGSNPREVLLSCAGLVGDAMVFKLTADAGDVTADTDLTFLPTNTMLRVSTGGFSHIRLFGAAGNVGTPFMSVGALAV
jgi:hypothetical protein